jgi:Long-chain acyl-CoA synthetases (AMP-forming)
MKSKIKAIRKPKLINDLKELVISNAEMFGGKDLYIYKEDNSEKNFTYKDCLTYMNRLGTAFSELELMGKRVAVIGDAHPYYLVSYYATVNGGGVIVPLDKELIDDEIINFINISEVSAIVYTESFNNKIIKFADRIPNVEYFIPIYDKTEDCGSDKIKSIKALFDIGQKSLDKGNRNFIDHKVDKNKMCSILFTSGTTGTSKGVMLSHHNLASNTNAAATSMEYDDRNTFVSVLPMHHTYETTCGHFAISTLGGTIYMNDSLKNVMRNFSAFKPNALMLVPLFVETMHRRIWAEIDKKGMRNKVKTAMNISNFLLALGIDMREKFFSQITGAFGGNLQSIVCGGAPLNPQLIKDFESFGIEIFEGYGITECSPLVAVPRPGKGKYHSVGPPVTGCKVKIVKVNPDDKTGEICVQGENVMLGYYNNEEATKNAFTDDGWFKTGDIGYLDNDGYIFITGRKKNVIILSNGKNIFPEEIEEHLGRCELIKESVVIGRENSNGDVVITAIIHPDYELLTGKSADEVYATVKQNVNDINKKLPVYKQVREIEIRETEFEKTTSKKIKRYKI